MNCAFHVLLSAASADPGGGFNHRHGCGSKAALDDSMTEDRTLIQTSGPPPDQPERNVGARAPCAGGDDPDQAESGVCESVPARSADGYGVMMTQNNHSYASAPGTVGLCCHAMDHQSC